MSFPYTPLVKTLHSLYLHANVGIFMQIMQLQTKFCRIIQSQFLLQIYVYYNTSTHTLLGLLPEPCTLLILVRPELVVNAEAFAISPSFILSILRLQCCTTPSDLCLVNSITCLVSYPAFSISVTLCTDRDSSLQGHLH